MTDPRDHLTGPNSAKTALSNAYHAAHRGDAEGAKRWIDRAEARVDDAVEALGGGEADTMEEIVEAHLPDGVEDPVPAYAEVARSRRGDDGER